MKLIYLKSAWKFDSFVVYFSIKIPYFRVSFTIDPGRSLLQFVTTNCLIPEKYIKVICAMYENNAVKVGNEVSNWFCIKSGVNQGCVLFPFTWIILMNFVLRSTGKQLKTTQSNGEEKREDLDYADDWSILDKSVSKMNEFLEVLRIQGVKICLKINVKKTKSLRLGISEDEKVTLGNEKIYQVGSFTYLGSIISKVGESSDDIKSRIAKAQGVFSQLKKVWKNRKISLQTKIRILEATVMTVVKYGSEAWALRKSDENLLGVKLTVDGTDRISKQ